MQLIHQYFTLQNFPLYNILNTSVYMLTVYTKTVANVMYRCDRVYSTCQCLYVFIEIIKFPSI